jgi:hypothetical protein
MSQEGLSNPAQSPDQPTGKPTIYNELKTIAEDRRGEDNLEESGKDIAETNIGQELEEISARTKAWGMYMPQTDSKSGFAAAEAGRIKEAEGNEGRPKAESYFNEHGHEVVVIGSINSSVDEDGEVHITGGHPTELTAPVVEVIRQSLEYSIEQSRSGKKVTVIYEGTMVPGREVSEERAMQVGHESALLAKLAGEAGLDIISGEPSNDEIRLGLEDRRIELEAQGITEETILAQSVLSGLPSAAREGDFAEYLFSRAAAVGIEGFEEPTAEEINSIKEAGPGEVEKYLQKRRDKGSQLIARLNGVLLAETGLVDVFVGGPSGEISLGPSMTDGGNDESLDLETKVQSMMQLGKLRRVREVKSEIRDQVIFNKIADASQQGDVLVVYGGSHIAALEPVLQNYYGSS